MKWLEGRTHGSELEIWVMTGWGSGAEELTLKVCCSLVVETEALVTAMLLLRVMFPRAPMILIVPVTPDCRVRYSSGSGSLMAV